jgi:hypothetical protein
MQLLIELIMWIPKLAMVCLGVSLCALGFILSWDFVLEITESKILAFIAGGIAFLAIVTPFEKGIGKLQEKFPLLK